MGGEGGGVNGKIFVFLKRNYSTHNAVFFNKMNDRIEYRHDTIEDTDYKTLFPQDKIGLIHKRNRKTYNMMNGETC